MALISTHPQYDERKDEWEIVRDCYAGEASIKTKTTQYLPMTRGMILDGVTNATQIGYKDYQAYLLRAVFHDLYKDAIEAYIGLLHQKPATINLPKKLEGIVSNFGETPQQLLRRINEEQLVAGRLGILCDLPVAPDQTNPMPYLALYKAELVRNWDVNEDISQQAKLNFVVLDESGYSRSPDDMFARISETRYRVCQLDGKYRTGLFTATGETPEFNTTQMMIPNIRGKEMEFIPFTFINTKDLLPSIDNAPLLGLARMMLTIYRGEADYRQNLFMQGQDTFVTIGGVRQTDSSNPDAPLRMGAGARIDMDAGGDAKYVGVNGKGLPEQRTALENDRIRAEIRAGQLVNEKAGDKESGEALKTRLAAQTATLTQIALSGGAGLEHALRQAAIWIGADPNEVKVEPNEEFHSTLVTGQDAFQLMQAKDLGLPISYESLHAWAVDRGLTKKTFEEDFAQIQKERSLVQVLKDPVAQEAAAAALAAKPKATGPAK